ncbi:mitochondrial carrier [Choiromyces venosus 120613-1]|uniref:Mitochondrial carrier n=1 Tax=Choiromyces venosus 120613-1 TaxID=1336337 RepID=A0A3N4JXY6_9PEZI|nr:mitochondrial carrier [Choiromyces venosus 120613-1]
MPAAALAFSGALGSSIANLAVFPLEVIVKRMQTQRQIFYAHGGQVEHGGHRGSRRSRSHRKKGNTRRSSSSSSSSNSHRQRSHSRTRARSHGGSPSRSDERHGRGDRSGSHSHKTEEHMTYTSPYVEHGVEIEETKTVWEHYESSSSEEYFDGFFETIEKIYAREGISGFYAGALEDTAGIIGSTFVHIMIHHYLRNKRMHSRHAHKLPIIEEILIGIAASSAAKFISTPFSTIVTRKQTHALMYPHAKPPTITDIFHDVMREKGITGFWSGYSAGFLLTLNPTITYLLYEGLKRVAGGKQKRLKGGETFLLAAVSKAIATGITYPLAVAKSRTQIQGDEDDIAAADVNIIGKAIKKGLRRKVKRANNVVHVLVDIFKQEGIAALYEGVMVEITRGFVSNGISILIKESVHRTILSLYYFVMRAYNRSDDHSFRSTTRIIAKDAYDNAGHKRKKLLGGAIGAAEVVEHGVESGRSKVSGVIEEGREKVEHIKESISEHTSSFAGKHKNRKSSDSGHRISGKVKLGAAALAAGAAAAHLGSRHEKQERREQHEGHSVHGGEVVVHTKRQERREHHEGHSAHGGDFVSHTKRQERHDQHKGHAAHGRDFVSQTKRQERHDQHEGHAAHGGGFVSHTNRQERHDQNEGHAAHGGDVIVHTKREKVAEWRDGVNESMADASINNRFGKATGHQSHVATASGAISDAAFHNQFARASGHQSHAVNFTGSQTQFEDDMLEARMSDHSRTGLVENVDVRELRDDRIHTGEMTVIEDHDHRHGRGHGGKLIGSHTHVEGTTIHGDHEHGHGHGHGHALHGLAHAGKSSHHSGHSGHDHLTDARIHSGETSFREEHSHSHSGMSDGHIRGNRSSRKGGHNGLADTRIITEKTIIREEHEHGAAGHGHGHGHSNALVHIGKSSPHSGRNDFLDSRDSRDSHMHSGKTKIYESHTGRFDDLSDSRMHRGKSSHSAGHGDFVESRTHSENAIFREGQNIEGLTDSRFRGDKHSHHEGRDGLVDTHIVEKTTIHEGRADSHDSHRFGESNHGRHSLHTSHSDSDIRGRHGTVLDVVNNAVAVGTAIGATVGNVVKQAVTGHGHTATTHGQVATSHGSHHDHKHHHRSHSQGREHGRHGKGGELVLHRQKSIEWRDEKLSDSDLLNGHSRDHHGKHSSSHSNHHTGVSSDSRANFEFEAERRHGHKSSEGHLGGRTERIVKETHVTKFADNLRTDEALQSPGFIRPGPTPFDETRKEVFHDARSHTSGSVRGPLGALGERMVKNQESTWVDNVSSAANGGAVKRVTHAEETWDIDDDDRTEVYNFMEEKRKAVPVSGSASASKVVTGQKWSNTSRGKGYE